jgi:putative ABC transport system substrate-binding protein
MRGIAGVFVASPVLARAQQPGAGKRIAVLMGGAESDAQTQARLAAFRGGLADLQWQNGRNARVEVRWGEGDTDQINAHAAELAKLAPDVILATNTPTARALKQATHTVPVVFAGLSDPIGDGIVNTLAKPGGNITGFTSFNADIAGKWLELLKEIAPATTHVATMYNPSTAPHAIFVPVMERLAPQFGIALTRAEIADAAGIAAAVERIAGEPGGALVLIPDIYTSVHHEMIFPLANRSRLSTVCPLESFTRNGGLVSYGPNFTDLFRQSAAYVDRILRGEKPSDLPVQDPIRYELVINLKTAKAIGLTVPPTLLVRADEVVE